MRYELEMARYAEDRGFSEIWQADTRLARDCIVMMSAFLTSIQKSYGSGLAYCQSGREIAAVIAATWSSMWELGGKVDGRRTGYAWARRMVGTNFQPGGRKAAQTTTSDARTCGSDPAAVHHGRGNLPR